MLSAILPTGIYRQYDLVRSQLSHGLYPPCFFLFFCLDQETAIMHRLQDTILEYSEILHNVVCLSAQLDW